MSLNIVSELELRLLFLKLESSVHEALHLCEMKINGLNKHVKLRLSLCCVRENLLYVNVNVSELAAMMMINEENA